MMNSNPSEVAIDIAEKLKGTMPPKIDGWCIYRVPNKMQKVNKDAYTPQVVSIGPFHHGNERLQNMEFHKWVHLKNLVTRTTTNLNDMISFIENLESSVRCCYAEDIKFNQNQLAKIIFLDAGFIIELFIREHEGECWSKVDPLSADVWLSDYIARDLLLLENQLPFFVLEKLFQWTFPSHESNILPSFLELTFNYFNNNFKFLDQQMLNPQGVNICHFTDLLRQFHLHQPSDTLPERTRGLDMLHFSATKLKEAGLRFEVNDESQCLLRLKFLGRVLKIPRILVENDTEVLFRNMVAFEQRHCPRDSYIWDYVAFLDSLVNTDKDVDVLIENGIIVSNLDDSDAVAKLFNGLLKNTIGINFNSDYGHICKELNEFYKNPYQNLKATLRRDYCKTPWQTAASIAGILLLVLTLIQTIFSGIQAKQGR